MNRLSHFQLLALPPHVSLTSESDTKMSASDISIFFFFSTLFLLTFICSHPCFYPFHHRFMAFLTFSFLHLQWTCWTSAWPRTPSSSTNSPTTVSCCLSPTSSIAWHLSTTAWNRSTKTSSMCHSALTCVSTGCLMSMTRTYTIHM